MYGQLIVVVLRERSMILELVGLNSVFMAPMVYRIYCSVNYALNPQVQLRTKTPV